MATSPSRRTPADPSTWLRLSRVVRFGDTDAAGVLHFARLPHWCHEAYEESLERFGLEAAAVFPTPGQRPPVALPIVHCSADFRRPLVCGDRLIIELNPKRLDPGSFEVRYRFRRASPTDGEAEGDGEVAAALTRHVAIAAGERARRELPPPLQRWLEASALAAGVRPL
jgi:1,4-dihydroxy-2-naphthoyl-CoA hydrolase